MTTYEKLVWIAENAKCGLYLTHNQHKDYYETAERYIKDREWEAEQELLTPSTSASGEVYN